MKNFSLTTRRGLLTVGFLGLLAVSSATAQRTDSLMTKTDVIIPNSKATALNGFMYYLADDGKIGYELWRTDGTKTGTTLVKDIRPGKASAFVSDSAYYYFTDYNNSTGYTVNPQKVKDALRTFRPFPFRDKLYFWADDGKSGIELWQSDGTDAGTRLVVDLVPGAFSAGDQSDILTSGGGYVNGTNGGYQNAYFNPPPFTPGKTKLQFWTGNVSNVLWETDGTAAGTREMNYQTTKYRNANGSSLVKNGRTFVYSYVYDKSKYYYTISQDDGTPTAKPILTNLTDYPEVLSADKRGLVYGIAKADPKQTTYQIFRRDSVTAKTTLLKQITVPKSTTGTSSQYVYSLGQTTAEVWLRAADQPTTTGKGTDELWRLDLATDSVQRIKRYDYSQVTVGNQPRLEKGSEAFQTHYNASGGLLFASRLADTTSAYEGNRYQLQHYDARTGKLQVLQDSLMADYNLEQPEAGGKSLILGRATAKDAYRVWLTDGRTKQLIKTLGVYDFAPYGTLTDMGLIGVGYTANYDRARRVTGYKIEVWKYDTTAVGTTRIGQANNYAGGVGNLIASGGTLYGVYNSILKLSSAAPDSIRPVADVTNFGTEILSYQVNNVSYSNQLGIINGRMLGKPRSGDNLLAIDPKAPPRRCTVAYGSRTATGSGTAKELAYCPAKDSVVVLKNNPQLFSGGVGEVSRIYYRTYQWLRDSTVLQSSAVDSLKLRATGQYTLTLRGQAEGCTATDTKTIYYGAPTIAITPRLRNTDRKELVALITGGYPSGGYGNGTYRGTWERTAADGAVTPAVNDLNFSPATGNRYPNYAPIDELVSNAYQPKYGTYTLKVTDANACSATSSYVYDDKAVILGVRGGFTNTRSGAEWCIGSPTSFTASATGGKTPYTYRWLRNGHVIMGATGAQGSFTATAETNQNQPVYYSVEATDADGKKTISAESLLYLQVVPEVALTSSGSAVSTAKSVTLTATCTNYQYPTFAWAKDGAVLAGVAGRSLTATAAGLYSVTAGSGTTLGCTAITSLRLTAGSGRQAAAEASQARPETGAQPLNKPYAPPVAAPVTAFPAAEPGGRPVLRLTPNPTDGQVRVQLPLPRPAAIRGRVLDAQGRIIQQWEEPRTHTVDATINLAPQPVGVYIIQVETSGTIHSTKAIRK